MVRALLKCVFIASCLLLVLAALDPALAQFGINRAPAPEVGGFAGWILAEQAKFYLQLSSLIRAAKADGLPTPTGRPILVRCRTPSSKFAG